MAKDSSSEKNLEPAFAFIPRFGIDHTIQATDRDKIKMNAIWEIEKGKKPVPKIAFASLNKTKSQGKSGSLRAENFVALVSERTKVDVKIKTQDKRKFPTMAQTARVNKRNKKDKKMNLCGMAIIQTKAAKTEARATISNIKAEKAATKNCPQSGCRQVLFERFFSRFLDMKT